jgi:hypothetical protein
LPIFPLGVGLPALALALSPPYAVAGTLEFGNGHREEPEAGLDLLRSALETPRAQQFNILIPGFIGALAEGLRKTGHSRRRFSRSMEPLRARKIVEWN